LDTVGREPFALLDEIERTLGIEAAPVDWPIGQGPAFQGVYHLQRRCVLEFQRSEHNLRPAVLDVTGLGDPRIEGRLGHAAALSLREEIALLLGAGPRLDPDQFRAGTVTPVFFGSALNSFGVEPFFEALVTLAPPPAIRPTNAGLVDPTGGSFSGFVFKIQANMDPRHRDRMAFLRICSGRFRKDMLVYHSRLGRKIRMSRPHRLFAQQRATLDEAFPGDVVGLINPGLFAIGDTLSEDPSLRFDPMPRFPPERFAVLRNVSGVAKSKQFQRGLRQLEEEGAIQILIPATGAQHEPILAAVGELQFDVVNARLHDEYGVRTTLERLPYTQARWVDAPPDTLAAISWPSMGTNHALDRKGRVVGLFVSLRELEYCREKNPAVSFVDLR
jgi:peptide chain release factor 3